MKKFQLSRKIFVVMFFTVIVCASGSQSVFSQSEKLGIVSYAPPKGWAKTPKENVVGFSEFNRTTGAFCIITLYGATPGTGNPQSDFPLEWNNLVVKTLDAATNPETETRDEDGWTAISGAAAVKIEGGKALAFLTVISGFDKTVSILGVFNEQSYLPKLEAFIESIKLDKMSAAVKNKASADISPPVDSSGRIIIPPPVRELTVADLAGEWGEESGLISTTYVNRSDGTYAGTDHLAYRQKMSITANGGYKNDFFAVRNGKKEIDNTTGTIKIVKSTIFITQKGTAKYVIRGWLQLPNITILKVCGPWFDDQEIPERVFTDPDYGANLNKNWVRKK